ncbi:MAG: prepilin-type N-terminal cleavage/methylation protein [Herbaspirillum sp.]|nr:prepilin-type N-terminal cleavage/methylation protein [Herbaspirillum sp.]
MVVLAIAGIALTLALPHFRQSMLRRQLLTATNAFFYAIQLTRAEAVQRNRIVQMAPLDDKDWAQGWRVYIADSGNVPYRDGDRVLLQHEPLPAGIRIPDPSEIYIAYNGGGRSIRRNRLKLNGHWHLRTKQESRVIFINTRGRVRICNPATDRLHCEWK